MAPSPLALGDLDFYHCRCFLRDTLWVHKETFVVIVGVKAVSPLNGGHRPPTFALRNLPFPVRIMIWLAGLNFFLKISLKVKAISFQQSMCFSK